MKTNPSDEINTRIGSTSIAESRDQLSNSAQDKEPDITPMPDCWDGRSGRNQMNQRTFYGRQWLMFAPGHDNLDHRVNRTINAVLSSGHDLTVYYEKDRVVEEARIEELTRAADILYMPRLSRKYFSTLISEIKRCQRQHQFLTVYVHDSGFIGLIICLIATLLKRRGDRTIFDYHDLLEWELRYQLSKYVRAAWIKRTLLYLIRLQFKLILRFFINIDCIIGISCCQIRLLGDRFGVRASTNLVAPNSRVRLHGHFPRHGPPAILWVGNVSKGRRFEWTYALQDAMDKLLNDSTKIIIVGKQLNKAAKAIVDGNRVIELGGFRTDMDIVRLTSCWLSVGVFFGWDDPYGSGINSVSSVNKVYSYINTLTPFLIPLSQINMIRTLNIPSEFVFETNEAMASKFRWIVHNYTIAQQIVTEIRERTSWDEDVRVALLREFSR